jgi:hypothetical protein
MKILIEIMYFMSILLYYWLITVWKYAFIDQV